MGIEHFVWIIDRAAIDEVLALSWKAFSRRYRWKKTSEWSSAKNFLQAFALDSEHDQSTVDDIVARRTLRWTMNRCSPKLFFMYEIVNQVPDLSARCHTYFPERLWDLGIVQAVGAEAFFRGEITQATFFSILRFCQGLSLADSINLKDPHYRQVERTLKSWTPSRPPFRWLSSEYFGEGYACLNLRETKSVVRFLERAWEGKWPATNLSEWARGELGISRSVETTIRDSDVAGQVLRWFSSPKSSGMCLVSYVEV